MSNRLTNYWMPVLERTRREMLAPGAAASNVGDTLRSLIEAANAAAQRAGFSERDVLDAQFAVAAWIDECAMTLGWAGANAWRASPLQRHYFGTTRAGVEFFQRLDALALDAWPVREVFALVLIAGFKGQFAGRPQMEFAAYRNSVIDSLVKDGHALSLEPSISGERAIDSASRLRRRPRAVFALLIIIAVPLALLGLLFAGYESALSAQVNALLAGR
ncbi:DotU family type IV/VI secretion system protein [Burkholderia sp. WSM2232]|uniref:DotU family type IV/VI secretion system protein n=1 Tax=Burkholderia sp. WSM2232 TaxID=944436 RepID=UPI00048190C1|nr:DotU/TssL family secretion system protein [Burkholderia sp. WSM2232]